jgi:general stress protein 26
MKTNRQEKQATMGMAKIRQIVEEAPHGAVATCADGQPRVRPMAWIMLEDGRLWSSTYQSSGKVREMRQNDLVEICFVGRNKLHARISGRVNLSGGPEKKEQLLRLNPKVRRHFSGGDDEKFVHVEVTPTRMEWTEPGFGEYHVVQG